MASFWNRLAAVDHEYLVDKGIPPRATTSSPPDFPKMYKVWPKLQAGESSSVPDGPRLPFPIPTRSKVHSTQPTGTPPAHQGHLPKHADTPPNIEINNITRPHHSCLEYKHTRPNIFVSLMPIYSR